MQTNMLNLLQGAHNFLISLGLIALLAMPKSMVQAQAVTFSTPLVSALTWKDLGLAERAISVDDPHGNSVPGA